MATSLTASTPLQAAFQRAVKCFQSKHKGQQKTRRYPLDKVLQNKTGVYDVLAEIRIAQQAHATRSQSKTRTCLTEFSGAVLRLSNVMDILAQHHPEYTSLAWGTVKLIFMVFVNHEELLNEVLNSFVKISSVLPRVELIAGLYTDPLVQRPLEHLSTLLVTHFNETLRLYEESRLTHIWKALIKPYSVRFEDTVKAIEQCTNELEKSGNVLGLKELHKISSQLDKLQLEQVALKDANGQTKTMILALHKATTSELLEMKLRINELHVADMIKSATVDPRLDPITNLRQQLVLARRQRFIIANVWNLQQFAAWVRDPLSSSLLILGTLAYRDQAYAAAAFVANGFQAQQLPVVWISKPVGKGLSGGHRPIEILIAIAKRLLQISSDRLTATITKDFNATHAASGTTEDHWASIVASAIRPLLAVCFVIDLNLVDNAGAHAKIKSAVQAIQMIQRKCASTKLKVLYVRVGRLHLGSNTDIIDHVLDVRDLLGQGKQAKRKATSLQQTIVRPRGWI